MQRNKRGHWACVQCKDVKHVSEFSLYLSQRVSKRNDGTARCNACKEQQIEMQDTVRKESSAQVFKRHGKHNDVLDK